MSLLQMSISAAIMIMVITVVRALTLNRLPKKTFPVLWGVVLLRLFVPVSKMKQSLSVMKVKNNGRSLTAPRRIMNLC